MASPSLPGPQVKVWSAGRLQNSFDGLSDGTRAFFRSHNRRFLADCSYQQWIVGTDGRGAGCRRLVEDHRQTLWVVVVTWHQNEVGRPHRFENSSVGLPSLELHNIGDPFLAGQSGVGFQVTKSKQTERSTLRPRQRNAATASIASSSPLFWERLPTKADLQALSSVGDDFGSNVSG